MKGLGRTYGRAGGAFLYDGSPIVVHTHAKMHFKFCAHTSRQRSCVLARKPTQTHASSAAGTHAVDFNRHTCAYAIEHTHTRILCSSITSVSLSWLMLRFEPTASAECMQLLLRDARGGGCRERKKEDGRLNIWSDQKYNRGKKYQAGGGGGRRQTRVWRVWC